MRKIKVSIDDLLTVLMAMQENGTEEIIFFTHNDYPAIADADDPSNIISFQSVSEDGTVNTDDEAIH